MVIPTYNAMQGMNRNLLKHALGEKHDIMTYLWVVIRDWSTALQYLRRKPLDNVASNCSTTSNASAGMKSKVGTIELDWGALCGR